MLNKIAYANAGYAINTFFKQYKGKNILLLVSGGSAFALLPLIDISGLSNKTTIGVLDERFDRDKTVNNYLQLTETEFYNATKKLGCDFIDSSVKAGEGMRQKTLALEKRIRAWKGKNPQGIVIITQGIGIDGHTAGIFPFDEEFEYKETLDSSNNWYFGYDVHGKNQYPLRITPTFFFLKHIVDKSFIYIKGTEKIAIVDRILRNKPKLNQCPAGIIHYMKDVTICVA